MLSSGVKRTVKFMKHFFRSIFIIGLFFAIGLGFAKLGMISPKVAYPDSFLGWFILITVLIVIDLVFEFALEKLNKKFGIKFWEKYSYKELKIVNTIIIILIVVVTLASVIFDMLR